MSDNLNQGKLTGPQGWEQGFEVVGKLFTVAQPSAVYSEALTVGDHTVITASEISVGMGVGFGAGGEASDEQKTSSTEGGGGGGGGFSSARPVAVISVGPDGVRVEPVVDVTKLALAFITAVGGMLIALNKMRRWGR